MHLDCYRYCKAIARNHGLLHFHSVQGELSFFVVMCHPPIFSWSLAFSPFLTFMVKMHIYVSSNHTLNMFWAASLWGDRICIYKDVYCIGCFWYNYVICTCMMKLSSRCGFLWFYSFYYNWTVIQSICTSQIELETRTPSLWALKLWMDCRLFRTPRTCSLMFVASPCPQWIHAQCHCVCMLVETTLLVRLKTCFMQLENSLGFQKDLEEHLAFCRRSF